MKVRIILIAVFTLAVFVTGMNDAFAWGKRKKKEGEIHKSVQPF